ncbi:chromosome segregation protein Csm1/Pcs1-domain-containing protein [Ilyonectria robusta]|uniref:chromosome segregation protein Csm1/Pcs1-domain-containing protein n=1 Tax=Ilyonectria robusta TaxID=1079257 RepID=UPI001E8EC72C|nr:chromosome segregation protein Csm1/Pcs1-domain-containing protein [Ilyonectria robusta]KAH8736662.1 chromosome segregation protein Csm1/Pcs1-domain-containing protein [Ilyonectria robusta]
MPRAKATAPLAGLVGSDSEPDFDDFDVSDIQAARNQRQPISTTKKPRGRPPSASKVTKPAPRSTGRTRGKAATTTAAPARKEALAGKSNSTTSRTARQVEKQAQEDTIDVEDVTETPVVPSPRAKPNRGRPRGVGSAAKGNTASKMPVSVPPSATRPRGRPRLRQAATPPEEIPETQHEEPEDTMDIDVSAQDLVDVESIPAPDPIEDVVGYDASDVSLRRRLGDLTKKYDGLEMRHRDLREVGVKEAERNFDRLRKQADERTAAANKLIAELKSEIAAQTTLTKQVEELRKELKASDAKVESLESTVETLNESLAAARSETKTISTKLAAFRAGEVNTRVPGSALKAGAAGSRTAQAEAAHAANQVAQAKEDLYGDLTDLILRGMRQEETEDVFDCIQTGRNGTLHFKLAVENIEEADSYENVLFTYRPQLHPDRDGDLMDMLPDYLGGEISFPRNQASKFYAKVMKYLTERPE